MAENPITNRPDDPADDSGDLAPPERDRLGRFAPGNQLGPGSPYASRVAKWRRAFVDAVSDSDIRQTVEQLKTAAFKSEPWAIRELLDRTLGKPPLYSEPELTEKLAAIERAFGDLLSSVGAGR